MIIYTATKQEFLRDASSGIEDIIRRQVNERLHRDVPPGTGEYESWKNSLGNAMYHVMNTSKIPADAGVAIEYSIPRTKNRIDFIVTGLDAEGKEKVVIIELKQWTDIHLTDKDAMVLTRYRHGESEHLHPSYQAWSYATLLQGFNATVYEEKIGLEPCAYLHNHADDNVIQNPFYGPYLEKAPAFCKGDKEKLQDFIATYVKHGDTKQTLYRIDNGRIRPSKELADSLVSMMKGNQEFVLIDEQKVVYETALSLIRRSDEKHKNVLIVEGGPGTGKSVVAINLLVATTKSGLNTQYVTKNAAPRTVFHAKLTGSMKKNAISNMFSNSGAYVSCDSNAFDGLLVDEAHRLNTKSGMFRNIGENQIKEIMQAAKCSVFFIDEDQRVTWHDIGEKEEIRKWAGKLGATVQTLKLESQFRCNGSDGYLSWLDNTLQVHDTANMTLEGVPYDFRIVDSPHTLRDMIFEKNKLNNKSRLVAGYCWNWISRRNSRLMDIVIPEHNFQMKWNLDSDGGGWLIAPDSVSEIGCIHTCQGLELDYIGVIVGPDLVARNGRIMTQPDERASSDASLKGFRRDAQKDRENAVRKADMIIKNTYRTLMTRGLKGCYVYFCDKETEEYFRDRATSVPASVSPSVAAVKEQHPLIIPAGGLEEIKKFKGYLPVYSLEAAAGQFGSASDVRELGWVQVSSKTKLNARMFVVKIVGRSMEPLIPDGSYCIFSYGVAGTRQGKIVLAQHNSISDPDTGGSYTVKRYSSVKKESEDGSWEHEAITLQPLNNDYAPIKIPNAEDGDFKIIAEFVSLLQ